MSLGTMLHGLVGPWRWDSEFNSNLLHQHLTWQYQASDSRLLLAQILSLALFWGGPFLVLGFTVEAFCSKLMFPAQSSTPRLKIMAVPLDSSSEERSIKALTLSLRPRGSPGLTANLWS